MASKKNIQFEQPSEILILFNRYLIIIIAVIVFAVLMSGYFFLLKPKINTNNDLQLELSRIQNNQQTSQHLLDSLEKLKEQYESIEVSRQNDLDRIRQMIPDNPQIAELFVVTNRLAVSKGFKLNGINIVDNQAENTETKTVERNANALDNGAPATEVKKETTTIEKPKNSLNSMLLQFSITKMSTQELAVANPDLAGQSILDNKTNYQLFKEYLVALEENLRLFDIQTVAFSSIGEISPEQNPNEIPRPSFTFTVMTYYR
ncbi:MAG: hypothetical protein WC465_02850 [Patescibacteria group bacterium]